MRRFIVFLVVMMLPVSAMAFSDTEGSDFEEAINYLRSNEIVEGYSDGTFRPDEKINRAELTKIVLESIGEDLLPGEECFPDIDSNEWYATYVCTAKSLGWVQGYEDGNFKPNQIINRVEAIKIIGVAEGWDLPDGSSGFADIPDGRWFTPYVVFAENRNFLPMSGSFAPSEITTRGIFAEVYFRILITEERQETIYEPEDSKVDVLVGDSDNGLEIESTGIVEIDITQDSYAVDTFNDMTLNDPFPKIFFEREVYFFEGELDDSGYDKAFVFVYPRGNSDDMRTFVSEVRGKNFSIPVFFNESGEHYVGIIPGSGGASLIARVDVEQNLPNSGDVVAPSVAKSLKSGFDDDQTYFTYDSNANFNKLNLKQGSEEVFYYQRQDIEKFVVNYSDFRDFDEGDVDWWIESTNLGSDLSARSGWVSSSTKSFDSVRHEFSRISSKVDLDNLPLFYKRGGNIEISGTTDVSISSKFAVIKPNGFVEISDDSENYDEGDDFSFSYDTDSSGGTYIIEVNDLGGLAVVNHPVYESGKIPLTPDYYDSNPVVLNDDSINESSLKDQMLDLINDFRTDHGLASVSLDDDLSDLAEAHSDDMVNNDFFSHINEAGDSPNDRRVAAGIDTYVGENITKTSTIRHAHEGFLRSAIHRRNIMKIDWTKVGLGVAKNDEGYLKVTQEFSTDISHLYNRIIDEIDDERRSDIDIDSNLQEIAQDWTDLMIEEDFFDTSYDGQTIFEAANVSNSFSTVRAFIITGPSLDPIVESILDSTDVEEREWTDMGLGLKVADSGGVKVTLVYAK